MQDSKKVLPFRSSERRKTGGRRLKSQLLHGSYVAEFFVSQDSPPVFHHLITAQGSREILFWGQCRSLKEAERDALETMQSLGEQKQKEDNLIAFPERFQKLRLKA